jgi:hypothetical protein
MKLDSRRGITIQITILAGLLLTRGFTDTIFAQTEGRLEVEENSLGVLGRQLKSFSPKIGPPGTTVTLQAEDLPIRAPLRVGVGALRLGFEEAGWILSGEEGEFTFELKIPSWATHEMSLFFIVFDPYFNPLALSEAFHVTNPSGTVLRRGQIVRDDKNCPTLHGSDRVPYALIGNIEEFKTETTVVVEGKLVQQSVCGDRTAIRIISLRQES